jgi:hypothetical protein
MERKNNLRKQRRGTKEGNKAKNEGRKFSEREEGEENNLRKKRRGNKAKKEGRELLCMRERKERR